MQMWLRKKKNEKLPAAEPSAGVKSEQTDSSYVGTGAGAIAGGESLCKIHSLISCNFIYKI